VAHAKRTIVLAGSCIHRFIYLEKVNPWESFDELRQNLSLTHGEKNNPDSHM
jgi:hypothetical protein